MNILQVVMNLQYGGVETYVARVSRCMVERGCQVTVLSQGGPLEELFAAARIPVVVENLEKGNLDRVADRLAGRGFDVINGHNYNSARVATIIGRKLDVPTVMTVHGPRSYFQKVTFRYWTPQVIATSGADAREICGPLLGSRERVFMSFLPVDLDMYSPREVPEDVRRSLLPEPDTRLVLHVSRFTNRKALVAFELLKAVPAIVAAVPSARFRIVGEGPFAGRIREQAAAVNRAVGPAVQVEDAQPDLSNYFNAASVVIATATTAQEAMACGAPVIAAGRTGHAGLVDLDTYDAAVDVLFADHGRCPRPVRADLLAADVLRVLQDQDNWNARAAAVAEKVARELSPEISADGLLKTYAAVIECYCSGRG